MGSTSQIKQTSYSALVFTAVIVFFSHTQLQAQENMLQKIFKQEEQAVLVSDYLKNLKENVPPPKDHEPPHYIHLRQDPEDFKKCTFLSKKIRSLTQQPIFTEMSSYVSECLSNPKHPELDHMRNQLDAVIGVMKVDVFGIEFIECTFVRLGERLIMTARHCFDGHDFIDEEGNISNSNVQEDVRFYIAANPRSPILPRAIIENPYYEIPENRLGSKKNHHHQFDYVLVETGKIKVPYIAIELSSPEELEKLVIYGVSVLTIQMEDYKLSLQGLQTIDDPGQWVNALRWDNNPTCVSARVIGACIYHGCQTERKESGAPIFRYASHGMLTLLGLHTRTANEENTTASKYNCQSPNDFLATGNGGISITSEMANFLTQAQQ